MKSLLFCIMAIGLLPAAEWRVYGHLPDMDSETSKKMGKCLLRVFPVNKKIKIPLYEEERTIPLNEELSWKVTLNSKKPFRAQMLLSVPDYAPSWAKVNTNGEFSFKKLIGNNTVTMNYGIIQDKNGKPFPYETVWGDAKGTVIGFTDKNGEFAVPTTNGKKLEFVIYNKNIIGGRYEFQNNSSPENPQIFSPTAALTVRIKAKDEYGNILPNIRVRSYGGGGSKTDKDGFADIGSLYATRKTYLYAPKQSNDIHNNRPFLYAKDHQSKGDVAEIQFTMGVPWHYKPQSGDILVQQFKDGDNTIYRYGLVTAFNHTKQKKRRRMQSKSIILDDSYQFNIKYSYSINKMIDRVADRRFDVYRLKNEKNAKKLSVFTNALYYNSVNLPFSIDKNGEPKMQKTNNGQWLAWALNKATTASDEDITTWKNILENNQENKPRKSIPFIPELSPEKTITFENLADTKIYKRIRTIMSKRLLVNDELDF